MIKKILTYLITIFSILMFILSITIIIMGTVAIKNNNLVKIFGYSYSIIGSESMLPVLEKGDFIIINTVPFDDVKENDIVVYKSKTYNINIVHRVIDIDDENQLITKGDNNQVADEERVSTENYQGIVIHHGKLLNIGDFILKDRNIIFLFIIIFFGVILIIEIKNIIKAVKEKNENELKEKLDKEKLIALEIEKEKIKQEIMEELKGKTNEN